MRNGTRKQGKVEKSVKRTGADMMAKSTKIAPIKTALKIALIGYGKMGREVQKVAESRGHEVVSIIDPVAEDANFKAIDANSLKGVDVCIDFTHPGIAVVNAEKVAKLKKNHVMGTTGWYHNVEKVKKEIKAAKTGFIYASNFSLGVNIFLRIVRDSSKYFNKFPEYDVFVIEEHHNQKVDSPSGTAKSIGSIIIDEIDRKKEIVTHTAGAIKPEQLSVVGARGGNIPGNHSVIFDSQADTIRLTHSARTREGFALGAVLAAEWINGKKGFYTIEDMMDSIIRK